ncbi:hypothetical protein CR51_10230 [Caballeronia megalochromosomata]|nr:hypothetical protein CR51_10230 [Caballeronia megalochromosomata]
MFERIKALFERMPFPRMALLVRRIRGGHEEFWRFLCSDDEHAYMFRMSDRPPKNSRMPTVWSLKAVSRMKRDGVLRHVSERFVPEWMQEMDVNEEYKRTGFKWDFIEDVVRKTEDALITSAKVRSESLNNAVSAINKARRPQDAELKISQAMTWLTRRWYYAGHKNCMAHRNPEKGGKGGIKKDFGVKKGRPNSNVELDKNTPFKGVNFNRRRKRQFLKILFQQVCENNLDVREAIDIFYLRAVGFFKKDGVVQSRPIARGKLPERAYLIRWAHNVVKTLDAQIAKLGQKEWDQKKRARVGNAEDITERILPYSAERCGYGRSG